MLLEVHWYKKESRLIDHREESMQVAASTDNLLRINDKCDL